MPSLSVYLTDKEYERLLDMARDENTEPKVFLAEFIRGKLKPRKR